MKKTASPSKRERTSAPAAADRELSDNSVPELRRDGPDAVVDDLSQQDFLPSAEGTLAPDEDALGTDNTETVNGALAQAGQWDDPVADLGHRVNKTPMEDEIKASEELVNRGVEEADEDLRELDELEEEEEEEEDER